MLFSGFTLLENSQTNNFYENNINTNNFISSNSPIYNLTIYIHNSPAGNGYYQQLFNFNGTSYFINNLNQNASNFYISYENGTLIYSWIQNWNFTTKNLSVWSKLQNGTKVIMIEIFNQNTNLLSANGFLGYNRTYFNAPYVFPDATDFSSQSGLSEVGASGATITYGSNGVNMTNTNAPTNIFFNNSLSGNIRVFAEGKYYNDAIGIITTPNTALYGDHAYVSNGYLFGARFGNAAPNDLVYMNATTGAFTVLSGSGALPENQTVFLGAVYDTNSTLQYYVDGSLNGQAVNTSYPSSMPTYIGVTSWSPSTYVSYQYLIAFTVPNSMPTFTIELNIYNINIKSFDKQSNPIHNYFFYNNSVYSANNNTFIFKNKTSFSEISLIPLNFSTYFTNFKNITISQSQFINNNNSYYYNLSIYYYNSNLNTVNPYDFANYIYPISILVFLLLGGIILFGTIKYRRSN